LHAILEEFFTRLPRLPSPTFIDEWERSLAYRDQWVALTNDPADKSVTDVQVGKLLGLTPEGALRMVSASGELLVAQVGELQLRPANPPM